MRTFQNKMLSVERNARKRRSCIMPVCAGERFHLVHKLPREDDRLQDWLKAIGLPHLYKVPVDKLRSSYFICSRHFRKRDYKNSISRQLNKTAVPCINLKTLDQIQEALDSAVGCSNEGSYTAGLTNSQQVSDVQELPAVSIELQPSTEQVLFQQANLGYHLKTVVKDVSTYDIETPSVSGRSKKMSSNEKLIFASTGENDDLVQEPLADDNANNSEGDEFQRDVDDDPMAGTVSVNESMDGDRSLVYEEYKKNFLAVVEQIQDPDSETVLRCASMIDQRNMSDQFLEITHPKYSENLQLNYVWLRDHCRCVLCYNFGTYQRKLNILEIPLDVKPIETELRESALWVKWNDEHESKYDLDFLYKTQFPQNGIEKMFWGQSIVNQQDYSRVDFNNYLTDDEVAKSVVKSLVQFGVAFIEKVPPNTNMTEAAIRRLFPIKKTFYGEMWTITTSQKDYSDTAYTQDYLGSHNDNTYWNDPAGLQILHCIKHTGVGGETFLVDGFKVLADFEAKDPKAYNRLANISIPAEYMENGIHYKYTAPMICIDPVTGKPEQIRYNVYDRAVLNTIPQSDMYNFYRDFRSLAEEVCRDENQWRFKLIPGTVLIFDNWRVLHGREKYTGLRSLTGCYVARSEFLNVARVMGLIS